MGAANRTARTRDLPLEGWGHVAQFQSDEDFVHRLIALRDWEEAEYLMINYMRRHEGKAPFDMNEPQEELPRFCYRFLDMYRGMRALIEEQTCALAKHVSVYLALTPERMALLLERLVLNQRLRTLTFEKAAVLNNGLVEQLVDSLPWMERIVWLSIYDGEASNYHLLIERPSPLTDLELKRIDWFDELGGRIADALRENTHLESLTIRDTMMRDVDARTLWSALQDSHDGRRFNTTLSALDLEENRRVDMRIIDEITIFIMRRNGFEEEAQELEDDLEDDEE